VAVREFPKEMDFSLFHFLFHGPAQSKTAAYAVTNGQAGPSGKKRKKKRYLGGIISYSRILTTNQRSRCDHFVVRITEEEMNACAQIQELLSLFSLFSLFILSRTTLRVPLCGG
jgi:hypothetical protein